MTTKTPGIDFITVNPATEAYQQGQINAQRLYANDLAIEQQMLQNAENLAAAPSRLRTATANADTARANADVAVRTVDPRVSQAQSQASLAGTQARVARETAPYTIDNAYQQNRVNRVNADVTQTIAPYRVQDAQSAARTNAANADVAVETAPIKVEQARTGLRQATATALNTEMQAFHKSLDLLNAGQTDAAIEVARRAGQEIPQPVIDNAELRAGVTQAAKTAQQLYPNRPRDQQAYIQGFIENIQTNRSGMSANDPTAPYNVAGAPTPPETSVDPKTSTPAEVATANWLIQNGVAPDAKTAWDMVRQSRSNPMQVRSQIYRTALQTTFGNAQKAQEITDQAMRYIESGSVPAPGASPAAALPAPSRVTPPAGLQGQGTRQAPWQATTQAHVDWFKASAPPGSILSVNGKLYVLQ